MASPRSPARLIAEGRPPRPRRAGLDRAPRRSEGDRRRLLPRFGSRLRSRGGRCLCEPRPAPGRGARGDPLAGGSGQARARAGWRTDERHPRAAGETAEQITVAARQEAEESTAPAKQEAEDIVAKAKTEAAESLARSKAEAEATVAQARKEAAEHLQRTKEEVAALREEAEARMSELHADTETIRQERSQLLDDIREIATRVEEAASAADSRFPPPEPAEQAEKGTCNPGRQAKLHRRSPRPRSQNLASPLEPAPLNELAGGGRSPHLGPGSAVRPTSRPRTSAARSSSTSTSTNSPSCTRRRVGKGRPTFV